MKAYHIYRIEARPWDSLDWIQSMTANNTPFTVSAPTAELAIAAAISEFGDLHREYRAVAK
jgi:hypothetical protein